MPDKKSAIVKAKPAVPAVGKRSQAYLVADNKVSEALVPLRQFQTLLDFATMGGRAACWGIISSAIALGIGVAIHVSSLNYIGSIGMMAGIGIYGTRILHRIKDPDLATLDEKLTGLKIMYARGTISKEHYDRAYEKAMKDAGLL